MDTRDGFIVGVYHYCDRWCDRCRLATRCEVFVDDQLERQGIGPSLPADGRGQHAHEAVASGPGRDAPDRPHEAELQSVPAVPPERPTLAGAAAALDRRARNAADALLGWRVPAAVPEDPRVADALRVIGHFGVFLGPKVHRALLGMAIGGAHAERDAHGSAKAALLALDALEGAWLRLAEAGLAGVIEAQPVFDELSWVKVELQRLCPRARAFVRPGFDEPEAVAMLEWRERG